MLNLFKLNSNKKSENKKINKQEKYNKHHPSAVREWNNSIYVFNKNAVNLIPHVTLLAIKLIKSCFNLYNSKLERTIRTNRLLLRLKRLSSHKIYVSNGEFKHTNNKVLITLYLFNRQKFNYDKKIIKSFYKSWFHQNIFDKTLYILFKRRQLIEDKALQNLKTKNFLLMNTPVSYTKNKKNLSKYIAIFYKKLLKKSLHKLFLFYCYKQFIVINESKFNYNYLQYLKFFLEKLYNKNVEFNLVNLRRFYLNSDILSQSIFLKLTKNRRNILNFLNLLKRKVKIQNRKELYCKPVLNKLKINLDKKSLHTLVLNDINYKHVSGFRLQASGRLTRRYTASRTISKLRYKGNLLNWDCSYRGLSTVLLKGNLKSNLQFTKLNSKTRIGSFGLKGWVSGN